MSCENMSTVMASTPCRQRLTTPNCVCYQHGVYPANHLNSGSCFLSPTGAIHFRQPIHCLSTTPLAGNVQSSLYPSCCCSRDDDKHDISDNSAKCICGPWQQMMYNENVYPGLKCNNLTPTSVRDSCNGFPDTRCCCRALFVHNQNSVKSYDQYQHHKSIVEDGQPLCNCVRHITTKCSCTAKQSVGQTNVYTPADSHGNKCLCAESLQIGRSDEETSLDAKLKPVSDQLGSDGLGRDVEVLQWQNQHLQQLAVQKLEILGRREVVNKNSTIFDKSGDERLNFDDRSMTKDTKCIEENEIFDEKSVLCSEQIEEMSQQIAELQAELRNERIKVKLYHSLFKQSQEELESLRANSIIKTDKSTEWETYCAEDRLDATVSDDVSSPCLKTSQTSDQTHLDEASEQCFFKWKSNSLDLTDEGVGSEQSSRLQDTSLWSTSHSDVLAKNNYNVRSLRQALKELSFYYNELLERNINLEGRLSRAMRHSKKSHKEDQILKELQTSYTILSAVVDVCQAALDDTISPLALNRLLVNENPPKLSSVKMLKESTSLRRNVEELKRIAFEQLILARYRQTPDS